MTDYNIIVYIANDISVSPVTIPVKYEKVYDLRRDVTNIGVNGLWQELENKFLYFPPNRITRIEIEKI